MPTTQKIHNLIIVNNSSLRFPEKFTPFLVSFELENKPKKRPTFDSKYQRFLNNNFRQCSIGINQAVSMLNLRAPSKFLSDLISYLSGKNIIAESIICPEMGSGVAA